MHHRYMNPHMQGGVQMQQNRQPMQGGMMPMHGGMNMQPNMNAQPAPLVMPNGMVVLPNGMVVTQQQAAALMQANGMQPNMNQGMNMQPNMGRFGNSNQTVTGGISSPGFEQDTGGDSRFQQTKSMGGEAMEQPVIAPSVFSVNVDKNIKFEGNDKVILTSFIEEVKPSQINYNSDNFTVTDCFEEAVESVIETANTGDNKLITVQNLVVTNSFFKTVDQDKFNEYILENDIKTMYKTLKKAFPTLTNKYDVNLFNTFDTMLTDYINDYVKVNASIDISIDSFMSDFNDLLKVIRNNEEELEDQLVEYMNKFISSIKNNLSIIKSSTEGDEDKAKITYIPESYTMCYIDKMSYELGISHAPSQFAKVEDNVVNVFMKSLGKAVCSKLDTNNFYMVTIDKVILHFMMSETEVLFVRKVS